MSKIISYSLFGFNKERQDNCFDFNSYIRGLMLCIRMNRLIYPDWKVLLQTDEQTFDGFSNLFTKLRFSESLFIEINEPADLTKAMLWRLKPCFDSEYTHVICRDLDSLATYREGQAVQYWINREKAAHAITDSVSHNIPMLGGMVGFMPRHFKDKTGFKTWEEMFTVTNLDFKRKGADQDFLNQFIYPKFAQPGSDSITQHYVLGMPNTFLSDCHNVIQPIELPIPFEYKESNDNVGHIGASGWYSTATSKFINKHHDKFLDLIEIEKEYSDVFSWVKNGCY